MILAGGDPLKFRALKSSSVRDYLLALDNFVPHPQEAPATTRAPKKARP
jgi:hypothetical protein